MKRVRLTTTIVQTMLVCAHVKRPTSYARVFQVEAADTVLNPNDVADLVCDSAPYCCRSAKESDSPLDALRLALDAMCSMKAPFYDRYHLLSAVERRVGGQGLVQFASVMNTREMVRCCGLRLQRAH